MSEHDKTLDDRYERQRERIGYLVAKISHFVCDKDFQYQSSWRKRGGAGAFMVMARKWDRFEAAAKKNNWDIFHIFANEDRQEGITDDCIDLIGYMLVLLEHMMEKEHIELNDLDKLLAVAPISGVKMRDYNKEPLTVTTEPELMSGMEHPHGFDPGEDTIIPPVLPKDIREENIGIGVEPYGGDIEDKL